jgi:UDPglucose 6-dehydrogenase
MLRSVSIVGLGKLGVGLAAVMAVGGFQTIGVDIEESIVGAINQGRAPVIEPGLQELISRHGGKTLVASTDHTRAIAETDVTFILVATPSGADGAFMTTYLESAVRGLATALRASAKAHHTFVICSTIMPETTDQNLIPLIARYSGRRPGEGFSVCYDPEFVALGEVIKGFQKPELIVIGEDHPGAGDVVEEIHRKICKSEPNVFRMSIVSAELAKVSLNTYLTVKISFGNMLANLAERISKAQIDLITDAIGHDPRISPHYLRGGPAYGGPCFPRDTKAFLALADRYSYDAKIVKAVEETNELQNAHLLGLVLKALELCPGPVGILGLSFKSKTPVLTASPAMKLVENLLERDVKVVVYDALALDGARSSLANQVDYACSARECIDAASVCVVANRDSEYKLAVEEYRGSKLKFVIDCWRILDSARLRADIGYFAWGRASSRLSPNGHAAPEPVAQSYLRAVAD